MTNVQSISNLEQAKQFIVSMIKTEVRCCICSKLLAKCNNNSGMLTGEIKCTRCGHISNF